MTIQTANLILTVPQSQALLDTAHLAYDGKCAAHYVLRLFEGKRRGELSNGIAQHDLADAGRRHYDNVLIMLQALKVAGLYADTNLRPGKLQQTAIQILAGFSSQCGRAHERADRERRRLAELGILLPEYNWGIPLAQGAIRRTAIAMYYRLLGSLSLTADWAGYSRGSLPILRWHLRHRVTSAEARQFWTMLPAHLRAAGIKTALPEGAPNDSFRADNQHGQEPKQI